MQPGSALLRRRPTGSPGAAQTVVDLRKESKACRRAGRERRRVLREGESLRVAAPEPFTPDSASSMEQVPPPELPTAAPTEYRKLPRPGGFDSGLRSLGVRDLLELAVGA